MKIVVAAAEPRQGFAQGAGEASRTRHDGILARKLKREKPIVIEGRRPVKHGAAIVSHRNLSCFQVHARGWAGFPER
jgi:hypothetical protein